MLMQLKAFPVELYNTNNTEKLSIFTKLIKNAKRFVFVFFNVLEQMHQTKRKTNEETNSRNDSERVETSKFTQ